MDRVTILINKMLITFAAFTLPTHNVLAAPRSKLPACFRVEERRICLLIPVKISSTGDSTRTTDLPGVNRYHLPRIIMVHNRVTIPVL